jgi:hypothetical protein
MEHFSFHETILPLLYGKTEEEAKKIVSPHKYSIAIIQQDQEMIGSGWVVSVRLDESNRIKDVFAWSRPVSHPAQGLHPDAWNDRWLDEVNGAKSKAFMDKLMDPNDPTGKLRIPPLEDDDTSL